MSDYVLMTIELGGFLALAALLIGLFAWLRSDMMKSEERLRGEIAGLRGEITETRTEVSQLRERMAHLEGLLEGLREAITGRPVAQ